VGGLFDPSAYTLSWLSAPYVAVSVLQLVVLGYVLFTRGNPLMRTALLASLGGGMVFSVAQMAAASCTDPAVAIVIYKVMLIGAVFIGPSILAIQLAEQDELYKRRGLLALSLATCFASSAVTAATDLVVAGVWTTPWDMLYIDGGPLIELHLVNLVGWTVVGIALAARRLRSESRTRRKRVVRFAVVVGLVVLANSDVLLSRKIGVYPMSWIPALLASAVLLLTASRIDLIRTRGRDWSTAWELLILAVLVMAAFGIVVLAPRVLAVALLIPILGAAQIAVVTIRNRATEEASRQGGASDRALDEFSDACATMRDPEALETAVRELLQDQIGVTDVRVFVAGRDDLDARLDARVRAWILANRAPMLLERLSAERLGGLREPIEASFAAFEATVLIPLVDRENLVGLVATRQRADDRALYDREVRALGQIQDVTARALTWVELYREAEARVEVAREVEVAAAVQHGRAPGEVRRAIGRCQITSHYLPAGQFGGDWWASSELSDGRVLVMIGDVTGHGVPAALVTATVEGCCETAQGVLGAGFDVYDLVQLVNASVLDVGKSRYLMSLFAAVIDTDAMSVTFANAGHPFPYLVRADGELRALVSRGMPLGVEASPKIAVANLELRNGDVLVMCTDAVVESENAEGQRYGERRLQRALRRRVAGTGDRACGVLLDDAQMHYGDHPIREDITLVCVAIQP
jgi:serine phosphatase RsbU (regulator of sigma subunit)